MVFDGTLSGSDNRLKLYLDGNLKTITTWASQTVPAVFPDATSVPAKIGSLHGYGRHFDGKVDEVRIYNRALSSGEAYELYASAQSLYLTGECNDTTATLHP